MLTDAVLDEQAVLDWILSNGSRGDNVKNAGNWNSGEAAAGAKFPLSPDSGLTVTSGLNELQKCK
jgi:hypothetical protein